MRIKSAPISVRRAILLLWATWLAGVAETAWSMRSVDTNQIGETAAYLVLMFFVLFMFVAFFIHHASKGRNWARFGLLGLLVLSIASCIGGELEFSAGEWLWTIAITLAEGVAIGQLFFGDGGRWYRKPQEGVHAV